MKRIVTLGLGLLAAALSCATPAIAETIFSDDFSGLSTVNLSGTTPDIVPTGSTATWSTGSVFKANGSVASGTTNYNAWLPFVLNDANDGDRVYTLSAQSNVATANKWFALGFYASSTAPSTGGSTGNFLTNLDTVSMMSFARAAAGDTANLKMYLGPKNTTVTVGPTSIADTNADMKTFTVVLDTKPANWTVQWYVDDTLYGSGTYVTNPSITYVGMGVGSSSVVATVDNFTLTRSDVPEPGTLTLLSTSMIGLLAYAWRKRK